MGAGEPGRWLFKSEQDNIQDWGGRWAEEGSTGRTGVRIDSLWGVWHSDPFGLGTGHR